MNKLYFEPMKHVFEQMAERELWTFEMDLYHLNTPVNVVMYGLPDSFADEDFKRVGMSGLKEFSQRLLAQMAFPAVDDATWNDGWWCYVLALEWLPVLDDADERSGNINRMWIWLGYDDLGEACEYRLLWTDSESDSCAEMMLGAQTLDERLMSSEFFSNNIHKAAYIDLGIVLAAVVEYLGKPATDFAQWQYPSQLVPAPQPEDYVSLLQLLNPNTAEATLTAAAQALHQRLMEDDGMNEGDLAEWLLHENVFHHDWKFDAEDLSEVLADLLGQEDFALDAPADTYGEDLFPCAQAALAKQQKCLMNYQSYGDSYHFFVLPAYQVDTVLRLSQRLRCDLEVLA